VTERNTPEDMAARMWFGYGRWDAPFWFIGMEPGGVDDHASYKTWMQLGGAELIDCRQHHLASNCLHWHDGDRPRTQATWRRLIQLLLGYKEMPADLDAVSIYQRDRWGTLSGEAASLNLSALHATNLGTPVNRIAHREERISTLRARLDENTPIFVVFYGTGYIKEYEKIIGRQFNGAGYAWHRSTLCLLVRHPTGQGNSPEMKRGDCWIRKGQEIRSLINAQAENCLPTTGTSFQVDENHIAHKIYLACQPSHRAIKSRKHSWR
jgi:hypothetical protein